MRAATFEDRAGFAGTENAQQWADPQFVDSSNLGQPEDLFGLNTEAALRLSREAGASTLLPPGISLGLLSMRRAVEFVPHMRELQASPPASRRELVDSVGEVHKGVAAVDGLAAVVAAAGWKRPREAFGRKVEREFGERIANAREAVAKAESDVNVLAEYENPREQFVTEVGRLAERVNTAIIDEKTARIAKQVRTVDEPRETPGGIRGLFVKAVRKVRRFFGFITRKPEVNPNVTAYDAGAGIKNVFDTLGQNLGQTLQDFPMFSKLAFNHLPAILNTQSQKKLTAYWLGAIAPEILNFLHSVAPEAIDRETINSVLSNSHELRFVTRFKDRFGPHGRYSFSGIQRASVTLLPVIRDVLPTEGRKVREIYDDIQAFLAGEPSRADESIDAEAPTPTEPQRRGFNARIKNSWRKLRSKRQRANRQQ
jgi:hypothetical protein